MKKTLCCLVLLALAGGPVSRAIAQPARRPAPTAAELKKNFAIIEAGTEGESDNFDELTTSTARRLVTYLKAHEVTAAGAKALGVELSAESADAAHLKVFTYSLSSGGTRGTIHKPVLQWRNAAGQLFAYAVNDEGGFGEIYKLASPGRTQYLLLGGEQGSSICVRGLAWLVELKGNYLLLDNKAFDNKPVVDICNVELTYDARRQTLTVAGDNSIDEPDVYAAHLGHPFRPFKLYFSQGRFVRRK